MLPWISMKLIGGYMLAATAVCPAAAGLPYADVSVVTQPVDIRNSLDTARPGTKDWTSWIKSEKTYDISLQRIPLPGSNLGCLYIRKITLRLILNQVIAIDASHKPGSCYYKEAVNYGRRGLNDIITSVSANVDIMRDPLTKAAQDYPAPRPLTAESMLERQREFISIVLKVIEDSKKALDQHIVDNLATYKAQMKPPKEICH